MLIKVGSGAAEEPFTVNYACYRGGPAGGAAGFAEFIQ